MINFKSFFSLIRRFF